MMVVGQYNSQSGQEALVQFLARSVLFSGWPVDDLRSIAGWLRPVDVAAGTTICREGDPGTELYLIESGQVQVMPGHGRYIYDQLGPGAFFGEIALLGDGRRTATVVMSLSGRIWALPKPAFDQLLASRPHLREPLARLATERLRVHERPAAAAPPPPPPSAPLRSPVGVNERQAIAFPQGKTTLIVGRHESCDILIRDPQVSRFHARLDQQGQGRATVVDLGSANGVYINGVRIEPNVPRPLNGGDEIWFGPHPYRFEGMEVVQFVRPAGVKLDAYHLTRVVGKGKKRITILNDISLSIQPGEFVAVVGGSGAGKSTLLSALTGFVPATEGRIFYNGIDYYQHFDLFRASLGYVPQDDIIHKQLTVFQVLDYAARLRLPPDTTGDERKELVEQALRQLQLTERRDTQVSQLSGGQRKRVSIGVELLNQPGLFFLDEPTSGLDPGLEETMMHLFRDLSRQGRTVIVITHATKNINICDKVIFLARGGYLAFYGTPKEALEYFAVDDFTGIYRRLESEATPAEWAQRFTQTQLYGRHIVEQLNGQLAAQAQSATPVAKPTKRKTTSAFWQFIVLVARYLAVLRRDRALLALFALQPLLIAFAVSGIFQRDLFEANPQKAVNLLFIMVVASIFIGAMTSAREITKEGPIYIRERLVNLKIMPYVASKVLVLGVLSVIQAAVFLAIIALRVTFPDLDLQLGARLFATMVLVYLGGMSMGLLISAFVANEDRATGFVPLFVIPQMTLAGAIIPIVNMPRPGQIISNIAISRWAFQNFGAIMGLNDRLNALVAERPGLTNDYQDAFAGDQRVQFGILALFVVILLTLTTILVKRKDVR
jgi:ABC-type multidrug transport system ATPase subunit/CRP-like cAMP-binding protein/ABC-type multidrug transport system permease subunit